MTESYGSLPTTSSRADETVSTEEHFVVAELSGLLESDFLEKFYKPEECKVIGLDDDHPILKIGPHIFVGDWENVCGTDLMFKEDSASHLLRFVGKSNVRYCSEYGGFSFRLTKDNLLTFSRIKERLNMHKSFALRQEDDSASGVAHPEGQPPEVVTDESSVLPTTEPSDMEKPETGAEEAEALPVFEVELPMDLDKL